jgi:adenylosuccinate synthase
MAVDLLLGLQWGDEGKGKIVDVLTYYSIWNIS